jgi:hypothetical protein
VSQLSPFFADAGNGSDGPGKMIPSPVERRRYVRIPTDQPAEIRRMNPLKPGILQGQVLDVSREGMRLRVPTLSYPGAVIEIRLADSIVFGEVRYCRPVASAFETGVHIQDAFRAFGHRGQVSQRKDPRNSVSVGALMHTEGRSLVVTILDISRTGLRVRCPIAVPALTSVEITWGEITVGGTIRYAREVEANEYNLGISADVLSTADGPADMEGLDLNSLFDLT